MKLEIDYTPPSSNLNHRFSFEENFEEMLNAGVSYAKNGNRAEARDLLFRVTESDPDNETAWLWLASISEYPEELLIFLQNVLRINPENERAIDWLKAAKTMLAETFVKRGIDASQENRKEFAQQCYLQALTYDSQNEMAWLSLASNSDSPEEKKAQLQKVLEINPDNDAALASLQSLKHQLSESLLKKANFAAISGDRKAARGFLEEAMQDAADLEEAWILKAYLADDSQEKISCYEKVLELNPDNETAQAGLASHKALIQKSSEKKSNAEMLRDVFEASGAEVLYADSANISAQVSTKPSKQDVENLQKADEQAAELFANPASEKPISETYNLGGFTPDTFENPTDELNANFIEEVKSQGGFAEESFGENLEPENLLEQSEAVNEEDTNENPLYLALQEGESEEAIEDEEVDEVLQFVKEAEARLFQNEETEPLYFENSDENQELEEDGDPFSYQLPEVSDDTEVLAEVQHNDELPMVEEIPQFNNHPQSNESSLFEHNSFSETDSHAANFNRSEDAPAAEEMQAIPPAENENNVSEKSVMEELAENAIHKSLSQNEPFPCSFCLVMNDAHAVVCSSCRTMLSLSDLETLLSYTEADPQVLEMVIEDLEDEKASRALNVNELTNLGIAYLNIKNLRKALNCLQEASQLDSNDVVLASKVNFLAIRLAETEVHESKTESTAFKNLTVMVVDDSATVRKLISGKLEKCGHTVVTAADGAEALGKIKQIVPDLILLDIMMPEMDGYQVCKLIRSNEPTKNVPVVMISGKDGFFDKVRGRMAGTTGYITKPFGPETLMRTIETYVP